MRMTNIYFLCFSDKDLLEEIIYFLTRKNGFIFGTSKTETMILKIDIFNKVIRFSGNDFKIAYNTGFFTELQNPDIEKIKEILK